MLYKARFQFLFCMSMARRLDVLLSALLLSRVVTSQSLCTEPWNATAFMLPSTFTTWILDGQTWYNSDNGVQFQDINGDGLVDVMRGYSTFNNGPEPDVICIWLNTGCGWVPQANFTGLLASCLPTSVVVADVIFNFAGMTVAQFTSDVASELELPHKSVRVLSEAGLRHSGSTRMDTLAAQPEGFFVDVKDGPKGRRTHFTRLR